MAKFTSYWSSEDGVSDENAINQFSKAWGYSTLDLEPEGVIPAVSHK